MNFAKRGKKKAQERENRKKAQDWKTQRERKAIKAAAKAALHEIELAQKAALGAVVASSICAAFWTIRERYLVDCINALQGPQITCDCGMTGIVHPNCPQHGVRALEVRS